MPILSRLGFRSVIPRNGNSQRPMVEELESRLAPAIGSADLTSLLSGKGWINYSPKSGGGASVAEIKADLQVIRANGFVGIITYASHAGDNTGLIPKLAWCEGLKVFAGLDIKANSSDVSQATVNAINMYVSGYVVGNETLFDGILTPQALRKDINQVRTWSQSAPGGIKPTTTADAYGSYDWVNNQAVAKELLTMGDWIFPNIQVWFDGYVGQCIERAVIQGPTFFNNIEVYAAQAAAAKGKPALPLVAHEYWWPSAAGTESVLPDPCGDGSGIGPTEANQTTFFQQSLVFTATNPTSNINVGGGQFVMHTNQDPRFVWGDFIDSAVKGTGIEAHFGMWIDDATPKSVVAALAGNYQDFAGQSPIPSCPEFTHVTGAARNAAPTVTHYDHLTGVEVSEFLAYGKSFRGGVRVAAGDVDGDGHQDIITGKGPGSAGKVKVFDALTGVPIPGPVGRIQAFGKNYRGGVFVAAGDVNGDGKDDIIVAKAKGGRVKVFSGEDGSLLANFLPFGKVRGGVRVAVADLDNGGPDELVISTGPRAAAQVQAFTGFGVAIGSAFDPYPGFRGGVNVAAGDLDGDGNAEIVTGPGKGAAPQVKIFSAAGALLNEYPAFAPDFLGGVNVGVVNGNVLAATARGDATVKIFAGLTATELDSFFAHDKPGYTGGIFVDGE